MTAEPTYNKHSASLAAIFILGDSVIVLPYASSGKYALFGFALSAATAFVLYFAALPIARRFFINPQNGNIFCKTVSAVLLYAGAAYALAGAGQTFIRFINYVDKIVMPNSGRFFIALIFVLITAALATRRHEVILKLSLIFLVFGTVTVLLFFLLSAKDFNIENISFYAFPSLKELFKETLPYFFGVSLPALLIPVFEALFYGRTRKAAGFAGLGIGLSLITLCLLDCLLLFGQELSARLDFPLSAAVSTVTVGPLFTRMDGVIYCLFFATALIKTAVCIKISYFSLEIIKSLKIKAYK